MVDQSSLGFIYPLGVYEPVYILSVDDHTKYVNVMEVGLLLPYVFGSGPAPAPVAVFGAEIRYGFSVSGAGAGP